MGGIGPGFSEPDRERHHQLEHPERERRRHGVQRPAGATWQITCTVELEYSYYETDFDTQTGSTPPLTSSPPTSQPWLTTTDLPVSFQLDFNPRAAATGVQPFTVTQQT